MKVVYTGDVSNASNPLQREPGRGGVRRRGRAANGAHPRLDRASSSVPGILVHAFFGTPGSRRADRGRPLHGYEGPAFNVIVGNAQFTSGGMRLSPRSYPGDGVLDVLVFKGPRSDAYTLLPKDLSQR